MADFSWLGAPQIAALLLLIQRGAEEVYSAKNSRALLSAGGVEAGRSYYPVVAISHLSWIAAIFLLIPAAATVSWWLLAAFLGMQVVRYWVIGTLGHYWTHRIITLPSAPVVRQGPYALVRHPNYLVTVIETALLPSVFGAYAIAAIFTAIWGAVIVYKIGLEDAVLAARRA